MDVRSGYGVARIRPNNSVTPVTPKVAIGANRQKREGDEKRRQSWKWNLALGRLEQPGKILDIARARVANHEIAQPTPAPRLRAERRFLGRGGVFVQPSTQRSLLKNKHGNIMLPHLIDQVSARRLFQISHAAAQQREF